MDIRSLYDTLTFGLIASLGICSQLSPPLYL